MSGFPREGFPAFCFLANRETLIRKLKEDIANGHVVIIAGTGVSIAACGNEKIDGHPVASWPGLLQHGLEYRGGTESGARRSLI